MNKCSSIHETAVGTIIGLIDDVKELAKDAKDGKDIANKLKDNHSFSGSIAKLDSNLTMVFPILCSKNINIENASMVSKAMERNFVGMLQRLFAANQIMEKDMDAISYISQFHKNLDSRIFSLDDVITAVSSIEGSSSVSESTELITNAELAKVSNDMQNINFVLPSNVNESALHQYVFIETDENKGNAIKNKSNSDSKKDEDTNKANPSTADDFKKLRDISGHYKDRAEFFNKQTIDSDYKKANELMPTMLVVSFQCKVGEQIAKIDDALVAVKAKLYPISSEDIISNISKKLEDRRWITNFIRATTREISFFKDFLFAIDRAKIDALAHSMRKKTTDKIWRVLERRSTGSKMKQFATGGSDIRPITTLCISQEEVEYLRKHHNVDMENISTIKALFNSLNLIAVVIVDESLEVAKFAFDTGDPMWETVSFTHLEREASDNSYKKVVNLMTKIAR